MPLIFSRQPRARKWRSSTSGPTRASGSPKTKERLTKFSAKRAGTTGYSYSELAFYEVSGDAAGYLNQEGIPAIEIELWTHFSPDWEINREGIRAMMQWAVEAEASERPNWLR